MNKKHTNKSIYTKLVMPRQLVLALLIPNQKGRESMILQTLYNGYI